MQLTITRSLAEIKLLDRRISSATNNLCPVNIGVNKLINPAMQAKQEQFIAKAAADYQSVQDLIARRAAIKAAVVISNATTEVVVAGKSYTVAAAIESKTSIANQKTLLRQLKQQYHNIQSELRDATASYNSRLDRFLESQAAALGKSKGDAAWVAEQTLAFSEMHQPVLVDPLNLSEVISKMEAEVDNFEAEVDYCLSESNARTTIEI